ncbi:hypothetical protein ACE6H2_002774 [Prunus campanulata]
MVFPIRSKANRILSTMAALRPSSICSNYRRKSSASNLTNSAEVEQGTHVELLPSVKRHPVGRLEASNDSMELAHECSNCEGENVSKANNGPDLSGEMKERFLSFKKHKFSYALLEIKKQNIENFHILVVNWFRVTFDLDLNPNY